MGLEQVWSESSLQRRVCCSHDGSKRTAGQIARPRCRHWLRRGRRWLDRGRDDPTSSLHCATLSALVWHVARQVERKIKGKSEGEYCSSSKHEIQKGIERVSHARAARSEDFPIRKAPQFHVPASTSLPFQAVASSDERLWFIHHNSQLTVHELSPLRMPGTCVGTPSPGPRNEPLKLSPNKEAETQKFVAVKASRAHFQWRDMVHSGAVAAAKMCANAGSSQDATHNLVQVLLGHWTTLARSRWLMHRGARERWLRRHGHATSIRARAHAAATRRRAWSAARRGHGDCFRCGCQLASMGAGGCEKKGGREVNGA
jgi:hypothetical protein